MLTIYFDYVVSSKIKIGYLINYKLIYQLYIIYHRNKNYLRSEMKSAKNENI